MRISRRRLLLVPQMQHWSQHMWVCPQATTALPLASPTNFMSSGLTVPNLTETLIAVA